MFIIMKEHFFEPLKSGLHFFENRKACSEKNRNHYKKYVIKQIYLKYCIFGYFKILWKYNMKATFMQYRRIEQDRSYKTIKFVQ